MPISEIQAEVLRAIAANRSPESYLAGATVLHRGENTPRYSQGVDLFHDLAESVALSAEQDAETLKAAGYELRWILRTPTFYRALVRINEKQLTIEWAQDSAFRFFPVAADEHCGFRLHEADAAVNKMLALAGRDEARDFVDVLHLIAQGLSLGALAWAACGKDPGFTPEFLIDHAVRHTAYTQGDIDQLSLREPLEIGTLKQQWLAAVDDARDLIGKLPADDLGCLYLDAGHLPVTPDPASQTFSALVRHRGTVHGAWPTVSS